MQKTITVKDKKYTTQLLRTTDAFEKISLQWAELLAGAGETHAYWTHAFLMSWLRYFKPQSLLVILFYNEQNKLCGALPLVIQKSPLGLFQRLLRRVQFIGCDPCVYDYAGPITITDEDSVEMTKAALAVLMDLKAEWDVLDFRFIAENELCRLIADEVHRQGRCTSNIYETDAMPVLYLGKENDERNEKVQKRTRQDLRRIKKHINTNYPNQSFKVKLSQSKSEAEDFIAQFSTRHITYWQEKGVKSDFQRYPLLTSFYRDLFEQRKIQCSTFYLGEIPLSYHIVMHHENSTEPCIVLMDPAFKAYRPGILHLEHFVDEVKQEGVSHIEFGRGDQAYKYQWTKDKIRLWNLLGFKSDWIRFLHSLDQMLIQFFKRSV